MREESSERRPLGAGARLIAGVLLAGFGLLLGFGALEVGVRVLHLVPDRFWQPDSELGTWHIPGKRGWWTQEEHEFTVPVTISSQGLRDVEHAQAKPQGTSRVLVLGDSYIEALQVPLEQSFSRRLESELNGADARGKFEVVSMGVSGYGTASELLYYRRSGRGFAPDTVVLAFYPGNDVVNNSPTLEANLPPVYGADGSVERVRGEKKTSDPKGLLGSVQSYQFIRKQILTRNPTVANFLIGAGLMSGAALREAPMYEGIPTDYWVYAKSPPADWEVAWRHTQDLIRALRDDVRRDGARFAVLVVTARDHVYPDSWAEIVKANPRMAEVQWDLEGPEKRFLAWCATEGIACLHLTPIFAAHREDGPRLHWVHDGHWTQAGHALAAKSMAGFLREQRLLPNQ